MNFCSRFFAAFSVSANRHVVAGAIRKIKMARNWFALSILTPRKHMTKPLSIRRQIRINISEAFFSLLQNLIYGPHTKENDVMSPTHNEVECI